MENGDFKIHIDRLTGVENWRSWRSEVEDALVIRGVLEKVLIDDKEPEKPDESADRTVKDKYLTDLTKFKVNCAIARTIIKNALSKEVKEKVAACESPYSIWTKLHDIFEQRSTCRLRRLLASLLRAKFQDGGKMSTYLAGMQATWADIQSASQQEDNVSIPDSILIECVFESLPQEKYREFNSLWDTLPKTSRTVDKLEQLLLERASRDTHALTDSMSGMVAKSTDGKYAKKDGNGFKNEKGFKNNSNKSGFKVRCYKCKKEGHYARNCPSKNEGGASSANISREGSLMCFESCFIAVDNNDAWYSDTGASQHITNDSSKFVSFKMFDKPQFVRVGSKELMQANGAGDLQIEVEIDGKWTKTWLSNVWYIKEFSNNLFSVQSTLKRNPNWEYRATNEGCSLFDGKVKNVKLCGDLVGGLYKLRLHVLMPKSPARALVATKLTCDLQLWHERMGHLNKKQVAAHLRGLGYVVEDVTDKGELCEGCVYGKMTQLR